MIPKYLKIKGLYSYQKEQEINFDPLTDASLFGIFGAVGSGKSSILEAITFALYGDTERLNRSGDDRTYNMMNLRSDELLIDFECIAGQNGGNYKFTVRGKRNSKNFKDVKTFDRKAYVRSLDSWVPLSESETTESIIGLSYDNFRRTIIIPQGRFQEFIELKDAERTRMMKELFQLEKYDLSRNVGTLSKENDLEFSNVEGQLLGLGEVTSEMISDEESKRELVRERIKSTQEELLLLTEKESQLQKLKLAFEKILLLQNQLTLLDSRKSEMAERGDVLRIFEICSIHFKSLLDRKKSLVEAIQRDNTAFEKNNLRNAELTGLLEKHREILTSLRPQYETREELMDLAAELEMVMLITDNIRLAEKKMEARNRGEDLLKEKEAAIVLLKQELKEREDENEKKKTNLADVAELSLVKTWFATFDEIQANKKSIKKDADDLQTEILLLSDTVSQKKKEANETFSWKLISDDGRDAIQSNFQIFTERSEELKEEIAKQILQVNTRLALQKYASELVDGEACPLCGSEHHPSVLHSDSGLAEDLADLEKRRKRLAESEHSARQFISSIERDFGQIETLEKQKGSIKTRFLEMKERETVHGNEFVWSRFDKNNRSDFERYFKEVTENQAEIRNNEALIRSLGERLDLMNQEKNEKIEKPLQELRNEILKIESTISTFSSQLKKVKSEDFLNQEKSFVSEKILLLKSKYAEIARSYEQTEKEVDVLEKENDILSGSRLTLSAGLEISRADNVSVQVLINEQLQIHGFDSEKVIVDVLGKPINISAEKTILNEYQSSLSNTKRDLENLQLENSSQVYVPEEHAEVIKSRELLTVVLNENRKEEGRLEGLLKKMTADLVRKASLLKEKARLLLRKEHLDDLARLFRSSGFVDYASSIYLQNLIQAANNRFHQMTHQQLHLELGEGNSFWVRDLLNGGHMRLLKTLSGGQKFQAALSLALALADHIHVRNKSVHNFFFLDEGFGSLDKNALQTVFETLKSLRKENRIVGIISHVEDLQQEIQTYLRIEDSEEGSRIIASWK